MIIWSTAEDGSPNQYECWELLQLLKELLLWAQWLWVSVSTKLTDSAGTTSLYEKSDMVPAEQWLMTEMYFPCSSSGFLHYNPSQSHWRWPGLDWLAWRPSWDSVTRRNKYGPEMKAIIGLAWATFYGWLCATTRWAAEAACTNICILTPPLWTKEVLSSHFGRWRNEGLRASDFFEVTEGFKSEQGTETVLWQQQ